ncbi:MAG TPA: gamma-glutamyltransferase, partial [Hyphomicrobiaceae bacterium]|nr:gamma-glutamyltransferase [Hyphomicrobiaceae bacterium]
RVSHDWAGLVAKLQKNEGARRHLLIDGRAPRVGERMRMPALAVTLEKIAREGAEAFYAGDVAEDMVRDLRELGGLHTLADFAAQDAEYVTPIATTYRGIALHELPPNNQGIVALVVLRMLERLGPLGTDPIGVERIHATMEVARLAYAVRDTFVADPAMAEIPVAYMLSDAFIDGLVRRIDRKRRIAELGPIPEPKGSDTIYMTVVDERGMAVSFINSLFAGFGSGIVARKSGITLQNRGQGFVLTPGHRNCIAPRKRPLHTLVPAIATEGKSLWATFGVMGGAYQPFGHAWVLTNMIDYGLDPQEAVDCPRVFFEGQAVQVEDGVPLASRAALEAMGHKVERRADPWGGSQLIRYDAALATYIGASDPRKDGQAIGY